MTEVGDGFYKFEFTTGLGYDPTKTYVFRTDAGVLQPLRERYNVGSTDEVKLTPTTIQQIVSGTWDEPAVSHTLPGSMGVLQNQTAANAASIVISMVTVQSLLGTLLKYQENRTKVNVATKTLTVYQNDGITPLKVFDLKDSLGNPSVTEIAERIPQ